MLRRLVHTKLICSESSSNERRANDSRSWSHEWLRRLWAKTADVYISAGLAALPRRISCGGIY